MFIFLVCISARLPVYGQSADKTGAAGRSVLKQKITCSFRNTRIEDVLDSISQKYKIRFTYVNNQLPLDTRISVHIVEQPLSGALEVIFRGQQVTYREIGTQILLKKKEVSAPEVLTQKTVPLKVLPGDSLQQGRSIVHKNHRRRRGLSFRFLKKTNRGHGVTLKRTPPQPDSTSAGQDTSVTAGEKERARQNFIRKLKDRDEKVRWTIGIYGSGGVSYRFLKGDDLVVSERNAAERSSAGYSFGFSVDYSLSTHFYFRTGVGAITFKERGLHVLPKQYLPPPKKREADFRTDTTFAYTNASSFLAVPFLLGFTTGKKWFVSVNSGIAPVYFLQYKTSYQVPDESRTVYPKDFVLNPDLSPSAALPKKKKKGKNNIVGEYNYYYNEDLDGRNRNFRKLCFMYVASLEVGFRIKNHFAVSVSPVFQSLISSVQTRESDTREKPYSCGLQFALFYALSR